ncbi:MAG: gliding motility-associated lipoprotein [Flavobacteriales bacterium]|nr:gliding motility-associated lipoprotein [Flavobacteriales bacterium]|tara:strand:- start:1033 stop:2382 length:1350 start_codon:yes stop_codon:yes gene_type:complete
MKKLLLSCVAFSGLLLTGCKPGANGELVGTFREPFFQETPFGMLFIPLGSFHMGPSDQEITFALSAQKKVVSVQSFYMDETEITNDEYRQFTYHVRDSLALSLLGEEDEEKFLNNPGEYNQTLNWRRIPWYDPAYEEVLSSLFYGENDERFYKRKQLDARKFNYEYWWIDFKTAALKAKRFSHPDIKDASASTESWKYGDGISDRSDFIKREVINIYPDTLAWVHDFTYSWNEPMTQMYFWHPVYDHYPVVGVSWKQATAFCIWRTHLMNDFRRDRGKVIVNDFRLPTEAEWEYASRGNFDQSPYPWGGPYIRNRRGCFLGNFKPLRGNYVDDGGMHTIVVAHYWPNGFGLYDMAGNVSEWTSNSFEEAAYNFAHDYNMNYTYQANDADPPVLKRKTIRGGSWKDIGYYMQTGSRTYEYQDTSKCYVGYRCVETYLGRKEGDTRDSQVY